MNWLVAAYVAQVLVGVAGIVVVVHHMIVMRRITSREEEEK